MNASVSKHPAALTDDGLSLFCDQFGLMVSAGIGFEEAASLLAEDSHAPAEQALFTQISQLLAQGLPLSEALAQTGRFPEHMIRMLEIGHASGRTDQVLASLSRYYRRQAETRSAIHRAVTYPIVMAVLIAVVFLVLLTQVLPVFQQVFHQLGLTLSPAAQAMLSIGDAGGVITAILAVLLLAAALFALFVLYTQAGARLGKRLSARVMGGTASGQALDRSQFASAMSLMLSSGLPLDEALERTAHLLEGSALSSRLTACIQATHDGQPFHRAVEDSGLLTGLQCGLLAAGVRSGAAETAMAELAARCQEESDQRLTVLLSRFEYVLVLILCLSVGAVLLSVMLPLLGVVSSIGV